MLFFEVFSNPSSLFILEHIAVKGIGEKEN